jgi:succinate-acetate transporter protein
MVFCFLGFCFFLLCRLGMEEKSSMSESVGVIGMIQIIDQILTKINEDRPNFFGRSNSNRYFSDI